MYLHPNYVSTRTSLKQTRRNQRTRGIFDSSQTQKPLSDSSFQWSNEINQGTVERRELPLATGGTSGTIYILGRSTDTSTLVSGNTLHINDGSDPGLFMSLHNSGLIETTGNVTRPTKTKSLVVVLLEVLRELSIARVINYLTYQFKSGHMVIIVGDIVTTPCKFMEESSSFASLKAKDFPIRFCGGPPKRIKQYKGTFLSLMVDKILKEWYSGNRKVLNQFLRNT